MAQTFGERVKQQREALGLTQADLANALNVSVPTIAEYESDKKMPRANKLILLAKRLNCSTDYLLGLTDIKEPIEKIAKPETYIPDFMEYVIMKKPALKLANEKEIKKWNMLFEKFFDVMEYDLLEKNKGERD